MRERGVTLSPALQTEGVPDSTYSSFPSGAVIRHCGELGGPHLYWCPHDFLPRTEKKAGWSHEPQREGVEVTTTERPAVGLNALALTVLECTP